MATKIREEEAMQNVILKNRPSPGALETGTVISITADELIALCPSCKTIETVYFSCGQLVSTRKFFNDGGHIYHDCGSDQPCRLYRTV
jgi:hypothetical protein